MRGADRDQAHPQTSRESTVDRFTAFCVSWPFSLADLLYIAARTAFVLAAAVPSTEAEEEQQVCSTSASRPKFSLLSP